MVDAFYLVEDIPFCSQLVEYFSYDRVRDCATCLLCIEMVMRILPFILLI